jgi:hypothetical protein
MKSFFKFISFVLVLAAVAGGVYLVMKNQETRRGAAANATSTSVLPSTVTTKVGREFDVHVWVNTGANTDKLVGSEFIVKFDPTLIKYVSSKIVPKDYEILNDVSNVNGELKFKIVSTDSEKSGAVDLVKLTFKYLSGGGTIVVKAGGKMMISGQTATWDIPTNNSMTYSKGSDDVNDTTPTQTPTPTSVPDGSNLKFACSSDGKKVTYTWDAVPNALYYNFQHDYYSNNSTACTPSWLCPNSEDKWVGSYHARSIDFDIIPDKNYEGTVYARIGNDSFMFPSIVKYSCPSGTVTPTATTTQQNQLFTFNAGSTAISVGSSTTLTWTLSSGSTLTCTKDGDWNGKTTTSGSQVVTPKSTSTYSLSCKKSDQRATKISVTVKVVKLPTLTLKASKNNIQSGKSTKLSWDVSGSAVTCTKSVGWTGTTTDSGNQFVFPTSTTTYSMVCVNTAGSSSVKSVTIKVQGGNGTTPTPTSIPDGTSYKLNYKMSFGGVLAIYAKCLVEWPFKITVMSNGVTKTFTDVLPQNQSILNNKLIFSGTLALDGFNYSSNVAVFASGPKHLQVKYGQDLQTSSYNQAGGILTLTKTDSPVYDFSGYPIVPGDVVSNTSQDKQDGVINGVDYAYVKSKANIHEEVPDNKKGEVEGYLRGDLNGDCQVNSGDVTVMKSSLQERQGQLY